MEREEGKRQPAQLALDFYDWLERGIYHSGGSRSAVHFTENSVDRKKNLVQLTKDSIEYIIGFTGTDPQNTDRLFVLVPDLQNVCDVKPVFSPEQSHSKDYIRTFGSEPPQVDIGEVQYGDKKYTGVKVETEIRRIPLGKHGGLSDNLFKLIKEEILIPLHIKISQL